VTTHTRTVGPNSGSSSGGNWDKCDVDACLGEAVIQQSKCVRHADAANRDQYLSNLFGNIRALSLRGVEITQVLINEILDSPSISENRRVKVAISFWGADLGARLEFEGYEFAQWSELSAAILHEPVIFHRCAFKDLFASFTLVKGGSMAVQQSEFSEAVDLSYAHADSVTPQQIGFEDCSFAQSFTADGITGPLMLRNSRCESNLAILAASAPSISLDDCTVNGELDLANTTVLPSMLGIFELPRPSRSVR
jgi:hypothetical protein